VDLFDELRPQSFQRDVRQVLQLVFLGQGSDHGAAVAFFEEGFEQAADSVFLVNRLAETLLVLKSLF